MIHIITRNSERVCRSATKVDQKLRTASGEADILLVGTVVFMGQRHSSGTFHTLRRATSTVSLLWAWLTAAAAEGKQQANQVSCLTQQLTSGLQ